MSNEENLLTSHEENKLVKYIEHCEIDDLFCILTQLPLIKMRQVVMVSLERLDTLEKRRIFMKISAIYDILPTDIMVLCCKFLSTPDRCRMARSCWYMHDLVADIPTFYPDLIVSGWPIIRVMGLRSWTLGAFCGVDPSFPMHAAIRIYLENRIIWVDLSLDYGIEWIWMHRA